MKKEELNYLLDKHFPLWEAYEYKCNVTFGDLIWGVDDDSLRHLEIRIEISGESKTYPFPIMLNNGNIVTDVNMEELRFLLARVNDKRLSIKKECKRTYYSIRERINVDIIRSEEGILCALIERSNNVQYIEEVIGKRSKDFTSKMNDINICIAMKQLNKNRLVPPKKPKGPEPRYVKY